MRDVQQEYIGIHVAQLHPHIYFVCRDHQSRPWVAWFHFLHLDSEVAADSMQHGAEGQGRY